MNKLQFTLLFFLSSFLVVESETYGDTITGSGTTNYIPKFTDPNTIGDSIIYESSSRIGVGTTSPDDKLTITDQGNIKLQDGRPTSTARSAYIGNVADGGAINIGVSGGAQIEFEHLSNNNDRLHFIVHQSGEHHKRAMTIDEDGNVGMNIANPQGKLLVGGHFAVGADTTRSDVEVFLKDVLDVAVEGDAPSFQWYENDQTQYRVDYGTVIYLAKDNRFICGVWEDPNGESEMFDLDHIDEFWSFHRYPTTDPNNTADHIMEWNRDILGANVRGLALSANWKNDINPQTPRKLLVVALDENSNSLVNALEVVPNGSSDPYIVLPNGNVGIGVDNPSYILHVEQNSSTDPIADTWTTYSSKRWKTNIKPIENASDKVKRLRGVSFDWKKDGKRDIGLIAEEVGQVIPEVVVYAKNGQDAEAIDYGRLVSVLIEAIKDQEKQIELLEKELLQ